MREVGLGLGFVWCERVTPPGLTRLEFFDVGLVVEEIGGKELAALVEELDGPGLEDEDEDGLEAELWRALEREGGEEEDEVVEVGADVGTDEESDEDGDSEIDDDAW
ncbi:hypothetical protein AOQ84DRAFT_385788 [Glonium stellatum]|uniref:Uncharacterized protein n=1 Tax=Glonium stellatum TaxID=574774 RepID=A0A8E2JXK8_9PEZI|nr:hypothetical protein AOQ84DRAFT_385788 [Glonium stellatum]